MSENTIDLSDYGFNATVAKVYAICKAKHASPKNQIKFSVTLYCRDTPHYISQVYTTSAEMYTVFNRLVQKFKFKKCTKKLINDLCRVSVDDNSILMTYGGSV